MLGRGAQAGPVVAEVVAVGARGDGVRRQARGCARRDSTCSSSSGRRDWRGSAGRRTRRRRATPAASRAAPRAPPRARAPPPAPPARSRGTSSAAPGQSAAATCASVIESTPPLTAIARRSWPVERGDQAPRTASASRGSFIRRLRAARVPRPRRAGRGARRARAWRRRRRARPWPCAAVGPLRDLDPQRAPPAEVAISERVSSRRCSSRRRSPRVEVSVKQARATASAAGGCRQQPEVDDRPALLADARADRDVDHARLRAQAIGRDGDLLAGHVVDVELEHGDRVGVGVAAARSKTSARRRFGSPGSSRVPAPQPTAASARRRGARRRPAGRRGGAGSRRRSASPARRRCRRRARVAGEQRAGCGRRHRQQPVRGAHRAAAQRRRRRVHARPRARRRCSRPRPRPAANPSRRARGSGRRRPAGRGPSPRPRRAARAAPARAGRVGGDNGAPATRWGATRA